MDFLSDCGLVKFLKKLVGRKGVEDALSRLDMLTKEESFMMLVWNLEVTHELKRLSLPDIPIFDRRG
jgi:hypothetical protein